MPEPRGNSCWVCGATTPTWALKPCPMCGKVVCQKCGYLAYGRLFCSADCGALFFHGDDDDEAGES